MTQDGHRSVERPVAAWQLGPADGMPAQRGADGRRVLVVDDSAAARDWLTRVLGRAGFRVTAVATASAGITHAAERPELIVCDVQLPDASGLTLTARLREDPRTADIPVLQISSVYITPAERAAGLHSGADAYLAGPLDAGEVLAVVEALLRARAAERARAVALERLGRLQAATAALARARAPEDMLTLLAEALRSSFGASGVGIGVLDETGDALELFTGETSLQLPTRWPVDDSTPFGRAVRLQAPVELASQRMRIAQFPAVAPLVIGVESSIDLPLCTAEGAALGVLGIGFEAADRFDADLLSDLQAVADLTGQSLQRAQLDAAERTGRRHLKLLQELTGALSRASDVRTVAEASVRYGAAALGAADAALLLRADAKTHVVAALGPTGRLLGPGSTLEMFRGQETSTEVVTSPTRATVETFPLLLRNEVAGALCFVRPGTDRLTERARDLARVMAEYTTEAILRAGAADRERNAFLDLQQNLLPPRLPQASGWRLVGRYRPTADGSAVGGDWYDAIARTDGRLSLVIGDVSGHGPSAAAVMSELRHTLHAYLTLGLPAEESFARINQAPGLQRTGLFATALLIDVDTAAGTLTLLNAGHPPALLIAADGVQTLSAPPNLPLGADDTHVFTTTTLPLPVGATLLLYTDGLIERRDREIDAGVHHLSTVVPTGLDLDATADEVLRLCDNAEDDTALILARHLGS